MISFVIGIDPGKSGAISVVPVEGGVPTFVKMPLTRSRDFDVEAIKEHAEWWEQCARLIVLEKLHSMPPTERFSGHKANYLRGGSTYMFRLAAAFARTSLEEVDPRTWQKAMLTGVPGETTKERSITAANALWGLRLKKSQDGIADALLIAEYGRRKWCQEGR